MSSQTIATLPSTSDVASWTGEERAMIEAAGLVFTHAYGRLNGQTEVAPRAVIARFLHTCKRTGLDPHAKQIYCIGRGSSDGTVSWSIQTAIDGFRVIAERSGKYAGQDAPEWLTEQGEWVQVFVKALHGNFPLAARVNVYRDDWGRDKPAVGIATWDEYAQYTSKKELTSMWRQRGPGQLAKCAEALALRKAFPQDLSGVYTDDEINNNEVIEVESEDASAEEHWSALIEEAQTPEDLHKIAEDLQRSGEATETLRVKYSARMGVLTRQAQSEVVDDGSGVSERVSVDDETDSRIPAGEPGADGAVDPGSESAAGSDA